MEPLRRELRVIPRRIQSVPGCYRNLRVIQHPLRIRNPLPQNLHYNLLLSSNSSKFGSWNGGGFSLSHGTFPSFPFTVRIVICPPPSCDIHTLHRLFPPFQSCFSSGTANTYDGVPLLDFTNLSHIPVKLHQKQFSSPPCCRSLCCNRPKIQNRVPSRCWDTRHNARASL